MKIDYDKNWGSHLPVLIKVMSLTKGSVLEMGMGLYSTPFLHWSCYKERILVSYDNEKEFFEINKQYHEGLHEVYFVDNWSKANIEKVLMLEAEKENPPASPLAKPMRAGDRGRLLWPLRAALTGKKASAGPFEVAEILGKEKTLDRIRQARAMF